MKVFGKKKRKTAKDPARGEFGATMRPWLTVAATLTVMAGVSLGVLVGVPVLQGKLSDQAASHPVKVAFEWPRLGTPAGKPAGNAETWLPTLVQGDLLAATQKELDRDPDPFRGSGLQKVAEIAAGSGWFEQITAVRREPGGVVKVEGQWRIPAAVVRLQGVDHLVARKGEVLPLAFERGGSTLRAIIGAQQTPPAAGGQFIPGSVWPGADVRAGLDLLAVISSRPWQDQVAAIDVSAYQTKKQLVIVTQSGGRIVWGGAINESIPGQVPAEVRLKRLDVLQHQYGAIDARHRVVEVAGPRTLVDDSATANAS